MATSYDAIVIGAGHNGLIAAAYLAKAGRKVLVLEKRDVIGGCAVTEELWPGCKVSTAAYVNSLLRPQIISELDLKKHGFTMLPRSPSSFTPFPDGRHLMMGPDEKLNHEQISKFSKKDAEAMPRYEAMLYKAAEFLEPLLDQIPPDPWSNRIGDLWKAGTLALKFRKMGRDGMKVLRVLTSDAKTILDHWFESEEVKVTLATDAVIGAAASPSMPGTAYVLFHHVMGECDGVKGVWGYVKGGMGALSEACAASAKSHGTTVRINAAVSKIKVKNGQAVGVVLEGGEEIDSKMVLSCVDANLTFLRFIGEKELPGEFVEDIKQIDYKSMTVKINVKLSGVPNFACLPNVNGQAGPQHRGTMHLCPSMEYIERAFDDAKYGEPARNPMLECTLPTAVDDTLAPAGTHLMGMFVQYVPYQPKSGNWDKSKKDDFAKRCFTIFDQYAPGFSSLVTDWQVLTPFDLEQVYGITGGNIMQGSMGLTSLFMMRPVPGWCQYRTPIRNLYLCGAAAHPGGGVMGAAGRNAARVILGKG